MAGKLRAVEPGEQPVLGAPKSMVEAAGRSRLDFLMKARETIAREIDAGVPPHALARLVAEADRLDSEVRLIQAADEQEAQQRERSSSGRRSFAATAI